LRVGLIRSHRLLEIFDGLFLACVVGALLVMQPTQLLQYLGVIGIVLKDPAVGALCRFQLFLLLVDMTNLEPNILLGQWPGWVGDDVFEAV
jgi:hypothetical protein